MSQDTGADSSSTPAMRLKAAHIRYGVNRQGTAIRMQYERLVAAMDIDPEVDVHEVLKVHMRAVADLDFLITSVRRLMRVAQQAKSFGFDSKKELKLAIKVFDSRWQPHLVGIRNILEHVDGPGSPVVPVRGGGVIAFAYPGGQVDAGKLYIASMKLCEAICHAIEPFEY
jgi:hypothetical protein